MYNMLRTIRGLLTVPGAVFATLVLSLVIAGCEEPSERIDAIPPAPITLSSTLGNSPDSITVTWTDPADADFSHILLYWIPADNNQEQPLRVEKGTESATIDGLVSSSYSFTAVTVDTAGNISSTSQPVNAFTDITSPAGVSGLTAVAIDGSRAKVTWTDPPAATNSFTHIRLTWEPEGGNESQPFLIVPGEETATITGLTEGTAYTFTAVAIDALGNTSVSMSAGPITADATAPAAVTNPTAIPGTNSDVRLTWNNPSDDDLSHILISWTPDDAGTPEQPLRVDGGTEVTINELTVGTSYTFTLVAVDAAGHRTPNTVTSADVMSDTTAPAPVTLTGTLLADGGIRVTWDDPADTDFSHIRLSWRPGDGNPSQQPHRVNSGVGMADIIRLIDGTQYTFTAKSFDAAGNESVDSAALIVTADAAVPAIADLVATAGVSSATVTWTNPSVSDFEHTEITWTPEDGDQTQGIRATESGAGQSAMITDLTPGRQYTFTATTTDALGHTATATANVTPTDATTPSVVGASATRINPAGTTMVTWTDPSDTSGFTKIAVTGTPAPTTAVEAAIGARAVTLTGLDPNVDHTIVISTLNGSTVTSIVTVTANATLPVALFRLGGQDANHDGDFGFEACKNELAGNSAIATALRQAGYTKAVFFGSRTDTSAYDFIDLATSSNALGFTDADHADLEARPVIVYADDVSAAPTTTFGSPSSVPRTIGSVVKVAPEGGWRNGGYDVVGSLDGLFWSFTEGRRASEHHCNNAASNESTVSGVRGGPEGIDGNSDATTVLTFCNAVNRAVICAAH